MARRADFPPLARYVWFQNGGVSLVPRPVHEAHIALVEASFLRGPLHIVEPEEEFARRDRSRARIAAFLGAGTDEIAIVRGVSEAFQHVLRGMDWSIGDELVITDDEDAALFVPALQLAAEHGVVVRRLALRPAGRDRLVAATAALLGQRTRLVAVSQVTTDWGVRLPVREICALAQSRGVPTFVDLAHSAGTLPVDLHEMGCAYAGAVSYKWMLGPYAAGALFVRRDRLAGLPVVYAGGRAQAHLDYATPVMELYDDARRFEYGPMSWPLIHAWAAALEYLDELGVQAIADHAATLTDALKAGLMEIDGVTLHSPRDSMDSGPLVAFGLEGWPGAALEQALRQRFAIVVRALANVRDGVRASVAFFTLESEVDALVDAVRTLARERAEGPA
jgi:selenocysteine lyase/cysteine desulfurase